MRLTFYEQEVIDAIDKEIESELKSKVINKHLIIKDLCAAKRDYVETLKILKDYD
jgi:hypothetical protein